jgi:hypothetical protein
MQYFERKSPELSMRVKFTDYRAQETLWVAPSSLQRYLWDLCADFTGQGNIEPLGILIMPIFKYSNFVITLITSLIYFANRSVCMYNCL